MTSSSVAKCQGVVWGDYRDAMDSRRTNTNGRNVSNFNLQHSAFIFPSLFHTPHISLLYLQTPQSRGLEIRETMTSWLSDTNQFVLETFGVTKEKFETFQEALLDLLNAGGEAKEMWKDAMTLLNSNLAMDQSTSVDLILLFALLKIKNGNSLLFMTTFFRIHYHATTKLFAGRCFQLLNLTIGDHVSEIVVVLRTLQFISFLHSRIPLRTSLNPSSAARKGASRTLAIKALSGAQI